SVTRSYYRNSAGAMLLFDLTNRTSFESVRQWHREVTDTVQPFRIVFLLVGHKSDLAGQRRVGRKEAEKLAALLGVQYVETSAKDASNVAQAFQMLTLGIYQALHQEPKAAKPGREHRPGSCPWLRRGLPVVLEFVELPENSPPQKNPKPPKMAAAASTD
ncbi:PREDICTED: ras-related protein Rab-39A, partial [Buceros rhinoceros silvestris]|uniref:ras-related protein Rab-39A n=1 Tax=Buceros rhinoceros silvestris TaxID=175836 RepID=UPI0005293A42